MHHNNNFHFLRLMAAILVIYGHSYPLLGLGHLDYIQELTGGLFPSAQIGVCIFFAISGYLIAKSLKSSTPVKFVQKRLLRIYPGLIAAVLFTMFVIGPIATTASLSEYFSSVETYFYIRVLKLFPNYPDSLPYVFKNLPVGLVNGSLWTLAYEITCYGALLLSYIIFGNRIKFALLTVFLLLWSTYLFWYDFLTRHPNQLRIIHLSLLDLLNFGLYFLVGNLIYFFQHLIKYQWYWLSGLILIFVSAYVLSAFYGLIPLAGIAWTRYLLLPYALFYFGLKTGILNSVGKIGDLSYGLYIYAFPVQQLIVTFYGMKISATQMFLSSLIFLLPIAWLSWNYIESPFLKLKSKVK
ncbi:acyltransferase family protein [Dyadobacter psychrotolerans]|uniref:Acyltransferase n=1 Tax=Dyadobacter psychrotolerans TaxID=2541721 RepID=A0A4R5DYI1_9BACT|nr:acyltransferase [Dyadobacter psychrotolerans]TDE17251.1 acyltransferase [Dyadobacter psychrotolerans]